VIETLHQFSTQLWLTSAGAVVRCEIAVPANVYSDIIWAL
jgi:hypothetical protein